VRLARELEPDVVLLDIAMPKLNGIEATRQIRAEHPRRCVLVLTAYDNEEFILAILEAGACGYLLKNIHGEELLKAIRSCSKGESVLHPKVVTTMLERWQSRGVRNPSGVRQLLTERELQVVTLGARTMTNKQIAFELAVSDRTIQSHWRNIFVKLGVCCRMEAVLLCLRNNWIRLEQEDEKQL
jgi:NarL family two-component system response regulator LiaR